MTLYVYGDKFLPNNSLSDGVWCVDSLSKEIGFISGDKIVAVDGEPVLRFRSILEKMLTAKNITIERDGSQQNISMPDDFIEKLIANEKTMLFYPRIPPIISSFIKDSNCEKAGFLVKDRILSINEVEIKYNDQMASVLSNFKDSLVTIDVLRKEERISLKTTVGSDATIGYYPALLTFDQLEELGVYTMTFQTYSFFGSFPAGFNKALSKLGSYVDQLALILDTSSGAYKGVGGFGAIGSLFPSQWEWERFWNLTAFLSLMLAFLNILPIPALDGGHVVFLLYEIVVGRAAPEKFMEYAQVVGMILLLGLVVFANGNDILKLF